MTLNQVLAQLPQWLIDDCAYDKEKAEAATIKFDEMVNTKADLATKMRTVFSWCWHYLGTLMVFPIVLICLY